MVLHLRLPVQVMLLRLSELNKIHVFGEIVLGYDDIKEQLLLRVDEIVELICDKKTIEIKIGKNDEIQLFDVKKKILKSNQSK